MWNAGTLEYWLHILVSGLGPSRGWAARTEVPYITACPAPSSKSGVKWADGFVAWPDGLGVLIEVKTIPMRSELGLAIRQVPRDLAAVLATNWAETRTQKTDKYTDSRWWHALREHQIDRLWALGLAFVPCEKVSMDASTALVRAGIEDGLGQVEERFRTRHHSWIGELKECLSEPLQSLSIEVGSASAVLWSWAGLVRTEAPAD